MPFPFDLRSQLGRSDNPLVQCPRCGRDVNLDMLRDVKPVKALLGISEDAICDSCMELFHRTEKLSRGAFYLAQGAPAAIVAIHAARDAAIKAAQNA